MKFLGLLAFVLLMCSCKSKESVTGYCNRLQLNSDLAYLNDNARISIGKQTYIANEAQNIVIEEDITVKEYDKEGNIAKETKTKRKTIQDSDKVVSEEEARGVSEVSRDSVNHVAEVSKKVESEEKEEVKGGQESFGKWIGIVIGVGLLVLIAYLCWKLKKRVS